MKKILLTLISLVCIFTTGICTAVKARVQTFPIQQYRGEFNLDDPPQTQFEKEFVPIMYKFRYADAIMLMNVNNYVSMFNVTFDDSSSFDLREFFQLLHSSRPYSGFTNKKFIFLPYIVYYQSNHKNQINQKIATFSDSQKKQYKAIAYNLRLASNLYMSAEDDMRNLLNKYGSESNQGVSGLTSIPDFIYADNVIDIAIYTGMEMAAKKNGIKLIEPSIESNVPKNATNLYKSEGRINITLDVAKAKEADALLQYWNNAQTKNPGKWTPQQLNQVWGVKGKIYNSKNDYKNAIACYNKAIALFPSKGEYYEGRAFAKWSLGDINGANSDYAKAQNLGSSKADSYFNMACTKVIQGKNSEAARDFLKVYQLTQGTKEAGLGALAFTYNQAISTGNASFVKNKILLDNPLLLKKIMNQTGTMPITPQSSSSSTANAQPTSQTQPQQQKPVIPVGCRVYLIFARFKDTHQMIKYTTIAKTTDIENMVNSDSRFEWARYESVPDQEYNNYPHY